MHSDDPGFFDGLYQQYGQTIYSHCLSLVGDEETVADITQETFVSAFKQRHLFADEQAAEGFLLRAADRWCDREIARVEGKDL